MIGAWRWFLALLVVVGHLYSPWWPASFGVFSFYIISGFLMALILNDRYGFSWSGLRLFWENRFLRIFPPYYLGCLVSIVVVLIVPRETVTGLNDKMILPHTWFEGGSNLLILGLQEVPFRSSLVPPAWSLSIELVYYAVISIWAAKSVHRARWFFALGLLYLVAVHVFYGDDWWHRYFHVGAGALPFAVGVNLYFEGNRVWKVLDRCSLHHPLLVSGALYVGVFLAAYHWGYVRSWMFYLNMATTALLLQALWKTKMPRLRRIDKFLGGLSYPTYLFHWQVGILVVHFTRLRFKSPAAFLISTVLVTGLALLEAELLSGRLDAMRDHNKKRLAAAEPHPVVPASEAA